MIWIKALHIAAVSLWSAGLICLPGLYVRRVHTPAGPSLHRLQALVRYIYVGAMSPAAFVGIASGTVLIFLRQTYQPWFALKLALVGVLATIHILTGLVVIRLFNEGEIYPPWRFIAVTVLTLATVAAILVLVLAKPELPDLLPAVASERGGLGRLLFGLSPAPRS